MSQNLKEEKLSLQQTWNNKHTTNVFGAFCIHSNFSHRQSHYVFAILKIKIKIGPTYIELLSLVGLTCSTLLPGSDHEREPQFSQMYATVSTKVATNFRVPH